MMPVLAELWRRLPLAAGYQVRNVRRTLQLNTVAFCSTQSPPSDVTIHYSNGLPVITLKLPSRNEHCQFTFKPLTTTVGKFLRDIQMEDRGIDRLAAISPDGANFSASTLMGTLLMNDFQLVINNLTYSVQAPPKDKNKRITDNSDREDHIKSLVHDLYAALHMEEHQLKKEEALLQRLETLKEELQPLEQMKLSLMVSSDARTKRLIWIGLAYISTQCGALAWLTWWVYSWDIMEPVTYFITCGNAIIFYAYFMLTKMDYIYPDAKDRQFLNFFHKKAKRQRFDILKYNELKDEFAEVEESLRRLRNPLQLKLPVEQLHDKD